MSTPVELRQAFLKDAVELVTLYSKAARGEATFMTCVEEARREVWDTLKQIIITADDPSPLRARGKSTEKKVENILAQVAAGKLTPKQAKAHMELVKLGVDVTELPKLIAALENSS